MKTYKNLKNRLNEGGIYIIEDIHGPKYNNYIYEKEVDKIKSLGFEMIDTDGIHTISYLGVIRT
jgi:spermidine synthase